LICFEEFILVGVVVFAFIVTAMQIKAAMRRREQYMVDKTPPAYDYFWFAEMPEGTLSARQPFRKAFFWWYMVTTFGMLWIAVNVPEWSTVGIIYVLFAAISFTVYLVEYVDPYITDVTGCMLWGFGNYDDQILEGVALATPFVLLGFVGQGMQVFQVLQIEGMPVASLVLTAFLVPNIEELFFRGFITSSVAEDIGCVQGAFVSGFVFAVFHGAVYHKELIPLMIVFAFGFAASMVDLRHKSILPGLVAHTIINFFYAISIVSSMA